MDATQPPENASFGTWLDYLLTRAERSRAWLARQLEVDGSTVTRWIEDINRPNTSARIQEILDLLPITDKAEQHALFRAGGFVVEPQPASAPLRPATPSGATLPLPPPPRKRTIRSFVVGREDEVQVVDTLVAPHLSTRVLNIYGPGGIGKTVVRYKLEAHGESRNLPVAVVDAQRSDLTPIQILSEWSDRFAQTESYAGAFSDVRQAMVDYHLVERLITEQAGLTALYDTVGTLRDPESVMAYFEKLGRQVSADIRERVTSRFALERYLQGAEAVLTHQFMQALAQLEAATVPLLMIDTYEVAQDTVDEWLSQLLVPALEVQQTRLLVFGRNALTKVSFDWSDLEALLAERPLRELGEAEVRAYLAHYGVADTGRQTRIYAATRGYPLLLVLMRQLAHDLGGWEKLDDVDPEVSQDHLAAHLLERILREQRADAVREFLEKGVVSLWFTPEIIAVVLQIGAGAARQLYDQLRQHSFVEPHPYGLKFHDVIRELLEIRLQQTSRAEYDAIRQRLELYFAGKSRPAG